MNKILREQFINSKADKFLRISQRKKLKIDPETQRLYDVVNEVRDRINCKGSGISTATCVCERKKSLNCTPKPKCPGNQSSDASDSDGKNTLGKELISISESGLNGHYALLSNVARKIEEILKCLAQKPNCSSNCKTVIEREMEKLREIKTELEKNKSKNVPSECSDSRYKSCSELFRAQGNKCNLLHVEDVEKFREKAVTGVVALEKMREQIEILENLIKKYLDSFPCNCDKVQVKECEQKIEEFRTEFDEITGQLCSLLQKINKLSVNPSTVSLSTVVPVKSICTDASLASEEVSRLRCESLKLEKEICCQEKALGALKQSAKDLEEEIRCKKKQLAEHTTEIDSKECEIIKLRCLIQKVCHRLKEQQCSRTKVSKENNPSSPENEADLTMLFCELNELLCLLEKSAVAADQKSVGVSEKLVEDNEKLKKKLDCLEKCINNKDETLKVLQDTVKLKECQIEELKSKMEVSENQSSKLTQDVEEKCRLISNLQEAIRKCKQFEAQKATVETLQFEICDLDCTLKKHQKEMGRKNRLIETLHEKLTELTSKNFSLTEKINILEPKLKIVYKTCGLFEKTVSDLQEIISSKEEEIECLYGKIKELENELDLEFKKFECRAAEDSKCIEELNLRLKNFQTEYNCAQESYNASLAVLENRLKNEQEASCLRERELNNTICQLEMKLKTMQNQIEMASVKESSSKINELESLLKQAECRLQMYNIRITDLQKVLECATAEREEERKIMLEKLCEEKKENAKNKTLITKLNESIKLTSLNEKILRERIENFVEDNDSLMAENQELRTEIEARKKIMSGSEKDDGGNLSELEKLICSLKIQKSELKSKCCSLRTEIDKEIKLRKVLECRVEALNAMLQDKVQEFNHMIETYKCTSSRLQQTLSAIKEVEKNFICIENKMRENLENGPNADEFEYLKKLLNTKTAENAKFICQIQVLQVEMESMRNENILLQTNTDTVIAQLRHEVNCLENALQEFQAKNQKLEEENKRLRRELDCSSEKEACMQIEFKEKQKELCGKLRNTICEKNDLLNSLDELQKQLEQICLDNVTKEKINRELTEECSRLKMQSDSNNIYLRSKTEKIISNLSKEVKTLHCELSTLRENYEGLDKEYKDLLNQYKFCEKKKCNLEKLYMDVRNENQELLELKMKYERELCELNSQNILLKEKLASIGDNTKDAEDKQILYEKIKELTIKVRTLEKRIIPDLEEEIAQKNCCIENLRVELREANISSQRIRSEAVRVIQCTKKYLAAQRCANETLKSRLECSNKRGNILGAENRELEEQLKAVSRMNEFLLNQLESNKNEVGETEPRSFSPLPWSCSTVERDTSSSEYLAESGFQSMQPSPTNMDVDCDLQNEFKRNSTQWSSSRKSKYGGSIDCSSYRNGMK